MSTLEKNTHSTFPFSKRCLKPKTRNPSLTAPLWRKIRQVHHVKGESHHEAIHTELQGEAERGSSDKMWRRTKRMLWTAEFVSSFLHFFIWKWKAQATLLRIRNSYLFHISTAVLIAVWNDKKNQNPNQNKTLFFFFVFSFPVSPKTYGFARLVCWFHFCFRWDVIIKFILKVLLWFICFGCIVLMR